MVWEGLLMLLEHKIFETQNMYWQKRYMGREIDILGQCQRKYKFPKP